MTDNKKLGWGIAGLLASLGVAYWGLKMGYIFGILIIIGAIIGAVISIKEIIQATKGS